MRFFIKHILKSGSLFEGKRNNQVSIQKKGLKNNAMVVKVIIFQAENPR